MIDPEARVEYVTSFGKITLDVHRECQYSENYKMDIRLKNRRVVKGEWRGSLSDAKHCLSEKIQVYGNIGKLPKDFACSVKKAFDDWRFNGGGNDWKIKWLEVQAQWDDE